MSEDPVAAIVAHLETVSAVTDIASTRIYGGELPGSVASGMPQAAVVVTPSGGVSLAAGTFGDYDTQRVDVFSYAATPGLASALDRAVYDALRALKRTVVGTTLLHWIEPAGGYASRRDSDQEWPYAFRSYQVLFHITAAA